MPRVKLILFVCLGLCLGSCLGDDDAVGVQRELLLRLESLDATLAWDFDYDDDCRLTTASFFGEPPAGYAPRSYANPLDFAGDGRALHFDYSDDGRLATVELRDSIFGGAQSRLYTFTYEQSRPAGLLYQQTVFEGQPVEATYANVAFVYDERGLIDSATYTNGNTVDYAFDDRGDLDFVDYQRSPSGRPTRELYRYDEAPANPFYALPLRYVMTYGSYWAPRLPSIASFDLRSYSYLTTDGRLIEHSEQTFSDSAAVTRYVYEVRVCGE